MPRFLDTHTGEFVWKSDPSTTRYAILSHTWRSEAEGGEQTYDAVRKLQSKVRVFPRLVLRSASSRCRRCGEHISPFFFQSKLSKKIKSLCKVARKAGYRLVWVDSCCIDQSSSAELSEAIKSMWDWYKLADVCYAYLADVQSTEDPRKRFSSFRASRWHRRGWTLQELIAPDNVVFLTSDWEVLNTKMGLATTLDEITGINFAIFTGRMDVNTISVACRLSWGASRDTTRIEDHAYSLMGIFGVHMTPIYGEGTNAFLRLQEEIIRSIPDQSIFAWGLTCKSNPSGDPLLSNVGTTLLARCCLDFEGCREVAALSPHDLAIRLGLGTPPPPLHCVFTPEGVRIQLLCVTLADLSANLREHVVSLYESSTCTKTSDVYHNCSRLHALALLRCQDKDGSLISLPLFLWNSGSFPRGDQKTLELSTSGQDDAADHSYVHTVALPHSLLSDILNAHPPKLMKLLLPRPSQSPTVRAALKHSDKWAHFWRQVDRDGPPRVFLNPQSKIELAQSAFTISLTSLEDELCYTLSLMTTAECAGLTWASESFGYPWSQRYWRELYTRSQRIEVQIQLRQSEEPHIVIKNCFWRSNYPSRWLDTPVPVSNKGYHYIELGPLETSGRTGYHASSLTDRSRPWQHTLQEITSIIHADDTQEDGIFDVRTLRLRIDECACGTSNSDPRTSQRNYVFTVALSEAHRYHAMPQLSDELHSERELELDVDSEGGIPRAIETTELVSTRPSTPRKDGTGSGLTLEADYSQLDSVRPIS